MSSSSFWRDRRALVTGATGFLGGWLVQSLTRSGAEVVCIVRDFVPDCMFLQQQTDSRARLVHGDVRNRQLLERVLAEYEIQTVFHLAAQTIVGVSEECPTATLDTNIRGTWTVLDACRGLKRSPEVIVASSDKAYGDHGTMEYSETSRLDPRHPYDVSKACADMISQTYARTYSLPVAITRCGNLYGGGDLNWNRLIPGTIRSVFRRMRPVIRSDGCCVRDYLYVEDAVAAYLLLAEQLAADRTLGGQAFNFAAASRIDVIGVVRKILALMKSDLAPDILGGAQLEISCQSLSAAKAEETLGWHPSFTFEDGLERTREWYVSYLEAEAAAKGHCRVAEGLFLSHVPEQGEIG